MDNLLGNDWRVFAGLTLVLFGIAAAMTGRALATTWRPGWQVVPYGVLMGCADRFFNYALFEEELLSLSGFVIDTAYIISMSIFAHKVTMAYKMLRQYPWIVERTGLMSWRDKTS